jgi:hypothetical protein
MLPVSGTVQIPASCKIPPHWAMLHLHSTYVRAVLLGAALSLAEDSCTCAKRRLHITTARCAGRPGDARRRWKRSRCGPRCCDHADAGGAGEQRHRLGRLRDRVGRNAFARSECLRSLARRLDAGVFQGSAGPRTGVELGDGPGRRFGLGRATQEVRQAPVRADLRACDPPRPQRVSRLPDDRPTVGGAGAPIRIAPGLSCRAAGHRYRGSASVFRSTRRRSNRSRRRPARRSTAASSPRGWKHIRQRTAEP